MKKRRCSHVCCLVSGILVFLWKLAFSTDNYCVSLMAKLPKSFVEVEKLIIFAQVWEHQKGKLETFVLCSFIPPSSEEYRMMPFTGERCTVLFQRFIVTNIIWECAFLPVEKELFHDVLYFLFWCSWSCWMQAVWIGHSFSYKVDKNYSVDVSWSHTDHVSPTVEPTNSYSNVCHLLFLSTFHDTRNHAGDGEVASKLGVERSHKVGCLNCLSLS